MNIRPLDSDLSLPQLLVERIQRGEPFTPEEAAETISELCAELERLRAYADLTQERVVEAERRAQNWAARVHLSDGRMPLLHRRVQEVWWKHAQDKAITQEEALKRIFRMIGLEGAYKPL